MPNDMKLPAFQFYPGDWRKDTGVQSLDYQARGVWFEILCLMHESERRGVLTLNGAAMPDSALARLLGIDEVLLKQILTTLVNHGVTSREPETGALLCRRMVRDENLRKIRQNAGKSGGNPVLLKQNPTTGVKQKSTPSSSSSVSSSDKPKAAASPVSLPFDSDAFRSAWSDWQQHRTEKREKLTPTSTKAQLSALAKMGERRAIAAIRHTIFKGWTGIREPDQRDAAQFQRVAPKRESPECPGWKTILNHEFPDSAYSAGQRSEAHEWSDLPPEAQRLCWETYKKQGAA